MITGTTKIGGIIGKPIGHSMSPLLYNTLAEITKTDTSYVVFPVQDNLEAAIKGAYALGIDELNITIPYKGDVIKFLSYVDPEALSIGAVNTLIRHDDGYYGYNTDMSGLKRAVDKVGISISGKDIVLIGAGGAAKSVAYMSAYFNANSLTILNRNVKRAEELKDDLSRSFPDFDIKAYTMDISLLDKNKKYVAFQSTSVGMYPNVEECIITDDSFYNMCEAGFDLVYTPMETEFVKRLKKHKVKASGGLKMLVYQGVIAWEYWQKGIDVSEEVAELVEKTIFNELERRSI